MHATRVKTEIARVLYPKHIPTVSRNRYFGLDPGYNLITSAKWVPLTIILVILSPEAFLQSLYCPSGLPAIDEFSQSQWCSVSLTVKEIEGLRI